MNAELCGNLIKWISTFEGLEGSHVNVVDFADGVAMAGALTQIAPEWFDADWISKMKRGIALDNNRLKLSNLKKVLKGMIDYYSEVLNQDLSSFALPDVSKIVEDRDMLELGRMLQLVLGCAINCEDKEQYIQTIMSLEETVQHSLMNAIQELMQVKENSRLSDADVREELDFAPVMKSSSFLSDREHVAQKVHDLEEQLKQLKEEKSTLMVENEYLRSTRSNPQQDEGGLSSQRIQQLQHLIDKMKEENFTLETAKEDYKLRCENLEKKVLSLNEKVENLTALAEESRSLKDEMDVLRHTQDKVARYEATIEAYKKKLGELGDMRKQMKTLEDKNEAYMQQTISLEEDSKKASALKAQVELHKAQMHDLQAKQLELEKRCDKAEFDCHRAKEKLQSVEAENQRLRQEREMLRETNEELSLNQANRAATVSPSLGASPIGVGLHDSFTLQDAPFELKEKIIRLEHQNKVLSLKMLEAENEKTQVLQTNLDMANERVHEVESENRQLSQQILELRSRLEDTEALKSQETGRLSQEENEVRRKLQQHLEALKESQLELQKKKSLVDELESTAQSNSEEISVLRDQLLKKDEQMREMEERYKKYLEKAKTMIRSMDHSDKSVADTQVNILQSRLQEKEKLIEHLERDHERMKATKEREEKLIVSAWYELSMQLHRKAADERLAGSAGMSFLARQRQAALVRRGSPSGSPSPRKAPGAGS